MHSLEADMLFLYVGFGIEVGAPAGWCCGYHTTAGGLSCHAWHNDVERCQFKHSERGTAPHKRRSGGELKRRRLT